MNNWHENVTRQIYIKKTCSTQEFQETKISFWTYFYTAKNDMQSLIKA